MTRDERSGGMTQEVSIPVLEIAPDWTVDDVETLGDCDDGHAVLTERIAVLEADLAEANIQTRITGIPSDGRWFRQATLELRLKKGAMQAVQTIRARLKRDEKLHETHSHDRRFMELFKELEPAAYARVCAEAQHRWPDGKTGALAARAA